MTITDVIRYISLCEIALCVGFAFGVMIRIRARTDLRANDVFYTWGMGVSYALFALGTALEVQLRLGTPPTWRTPIVFAAATVGLFTQMFTFFRDDRKNRK